MHPKVPLTDKLFRLALHMAALPALIAGNFGGLWFCVLYFGAFALVSLLHEALGRGEPAWREWAFIAVKAVVAALCLIRFEGLGPAFLLCIIVQDVCFACRPLVSGVLGAAALGALVIREAASADVIFLEAALLATIWLLAHALKGEKQLRGSMEETISALRVSEKRLADSNRQIRECNGRLEEAARLRERGRIAKGIHDTLGHTLTAIAVQLSAALQVIGRDQNAAAESVKNARDQAKRGLESVRETIHMLEASGMSFGEKLRQAVEAAEGGMRIRVLPVVEAGIDLSEEKQQVVLSCLKEGLTNGVRHGGATAFVLKLEAADGHIRFYLEDNGSGCAALTKGYGLTAMEEMVEQAGGTLEAASVPGEGFYLRATLPEDCGNGEQDT